MNCVVEHAGACQDKFRPPIEGAVLSPFVEITFGGDENKKITVGNESSPGFGHNAVIKSFEYGFSDGMNFEIEIIDEEGGAFQFWVDRVVRNLDKASESYMALVKFGWIIAHCDGSTEKKSSPPLTAMCRNMDVIFGEGKVKYKLTLTDLMQAVFVSREDEIIGDDKNPVDIKQAITELLSKNEPKVNVQFVRRGQDGTLSEWEYKGEIKSGWAGDNQNKLSATMKLTEPFMTENDKGVTAVWATDQEKPTLYLLEDTGQACNENGGCSGALGMWIVNGGNCSNVISFTPTINYVSAAAALNVGGNTGGAGSAEGVKKKADDRCGSVQGDRIGLQQSTAISRQAWAVHGPDEATKNTSRAQEAHSDASRNTVPQLMPIEAEMKIQGNPDWVVMASLVGRPCSIVVINPFHLKPDGNQCGDWLAQPVCNDVLSNKNWLLMGVHHSIREGSFVTTMKLRLPAPSMDFAEGTGFGGEGYVPQWGS